jgi:hypothetical protein
MKLLQGDRPVHGGDVEPATWMGRRLLGVLALAVAWMPKRSLAAWFACVAIAAMLLLPSTAQTSDDTEAYLGDGHVDPGEDETGELARAVQNPVADLISLPFQNNTNFEFGPKEETFNRLNIQPVIPFSISEDWQVITRTILPIASQPQLLPGQSRETGLGDTTFTAFFSPKAPALSGKLIWGAGPIALIPTASDDRLGSDRWGLGPSLVMLTVQGPWVAGSLFSQVWGTGGSGNRYSSNVSLFTWQYFVNYNLPGGLYLVSSPILTANWKAQRSSDTWTVPFGGGVGKIFRFGGLPPLNASIQTFYNVARPKAVGRWELRAQLQFLFPRRH